MLETILQVYLQMTRHGIVVPGNPDDERKLVMDLSEKVERGSDVRMWFYRGDVPLKIVTVGAWIDRARKYVALLPARRKEPSYRFEEQAYEGDYGEEGWDQEEGEKDYDDQEGEAIEQEMTETINRLNDL